MPCCSCLTELKLSKGINMFFSAITLALLSCTYVSAYVNNWDRPVNFACGRGKSIFLIKSIHSNYYEDRRWDFQCRPTPGMTKTCHWYNDLNGWDKQLLFTCPNNAVITGIKSDHSNYYEDRRFSIKCCAVKDNLNHCSLSSYVNYWDKPMDYIVPSGRFLAGAKSVHSNYYEDRRWRFNTCKLG